MELPSYGSFACIQGGAAIPGGGRGSSPGGGAPGGTWPLGAPYMGAHGAGMPGGTLGGGRTDVFISDCRNAIDVIGAPPWPVGGGGGGAGGRPESPGGPWPAALRPGGPVGRGGVPSPGGASAGEADEGCRALISLDMSICIDAMSAALGLGAAPCSGSDGGSTDGAAAWVGGETSGECACDTGWE